MKTTSTVRAYTSDVFAIGSSIWCAVATIVLTVDILSSAGMPAGRTVVATSLVGVMVALFVLTTAHVRVIAHLITCPTGWGSDVGARFRVRPCGALNVCRSELLPLSGSAFRPRGARHGTSFAPARRCTSK